MLVYGGQGEEAITTVSNTRNVNNNTINKIQEKKPAGGKERRTAGVEQGNREQGEGKGGWGTGGSRCRGEAGGTATVRNLVRTNPSRASGAQAASSTDSLTD